MHDLLSAARRFATTVDADPERFARLSTPQEPEVLLITCSDSRVVPEALLDAGPGRVFGLRNAGGIVPAYAPGSPGAEQATVEYALRVLGIRDVVVAGHSDCGAVRALVGDPVPELPEVSGWLAPCPVPVDPPTFSDAVQDHVLHQTRALATHPAVDDEVRVHPWFIDLDGRRVLRHDAAADAFVAL